MPGEHDAAERPVGGAGSEESTVGEHRQLNCGECGNKTFLVAAEVIDGEGRVFAIECSDCGEFTEVR